MRSRFMGQRRRQAPLLLPVTIMAAFMRGCTIYRPRHSTPRAIHGWRPTGAAIPTRTPTTGRPAAARVRLVARRWRRRPACCRHSRSSVRPSNGRHPPRRSPRSRLTAPTDRPDPPSP